jgi:hypothetical protein
LTLFNNLATNSGLAQSLPNGSTVIPLIQAGRVGSLAQFYLIQGLNGTVPIVKNPNIFIDEIISNGGRLRYNSLQAEVRRRFQTDFLSRRITRLQKR